MGPAGRSAYGRSRAAGPLKATYAHGSGLPAAAQQLEFAHHGHLRRAVDHAPDHNSGSSAVPRAAAPASPIGAHGDHRLRRAGIGRTASHDADGLMPHGEHPESPLHPACGENRLRRAGACQPGTVCVWGGLRCAAIWVRGLRSRARSRVAAQRHAC
jgi:hypothetical protein